MHYTVVPVKNPDGEQRWTVIAHKGQFESSTRFYGGDHHWEELELAELAREAYYSGLAHHGDAPRKVIIAGLRSKIGSSTEEGAEKWASMLRPAEVADVMEDMIENPRSYNWAQHKYMRLRAVLIIRDTVRNSTEKADK